MYFEIVGPITDIETIALGQGYGGAGKGPTPLDTVVLAGEHRLWLCSFTSALRELRGEA